MTLFLILSELIAKEIYFDSRQYRSSNRIGFEAGLKYGSARLRGYKASDDLTETN